jgi:hypothetical protein
MGRGNHENEEVVFVVAVTAVTFDSLIPAKVFPAFLASSY